MVTDAIPLVFSYAYALIRIDLPVNATIALSSVAGSAPRVPIPVVVTPVTAAIDCTSNVLPAPTDTLVTL